MMYACNSAIFRGIPLAMRGVKSVMTYETCPLLSDYKVSGTLTPDATCNYFYAGLYGGYSYYKNANNYCIWYMSDAEIYFITHFDNIGNGSGLCWWSDSKSGDFYPLGGAIGIAHVSAGGL